MTDARLFAGLIDLAARELGGSAVGASDEFFAAASELLAPEPATFDAARYTERGKWMDGWETRRRRAGGHDFCVIELGAPGRVYGLDIDTRHFVGNHPPFASVEGVRAPAKLPFAELVTLPWRTLLPQAPLGPGCRNLFAAEPTEAVSHVRLRIFPDGGVARFRVYGKVEAFAAAQERDELTQSHVPAGLVDLAALKNGAMTLACSDARFGHMNSLLLPGRARVMGEGWETRRGRAPDHRHDWLIIALAARGTIETLEVDTNHYFGNYPEHWSLEAIDAPGATPTELLGSTQFRTLVPNTPLSANSRHFFRDELVAHAPVSHVRLNIFPDGGISRLRLWGRPKGGD